MDERKLSYEEMQQELPDYLFGRLSEERRRAFEATLPDFPDLREEIQGVRKVFAKVDRMDLDAKMEFRSRNVSVKVLDRLEARRRNAWTWRKATVPGLGLIALVIIVFNLYKTPEDDNIKRQSTPATAKTEEVILNVIDSSDVASLLATPKDSAEAAAAVNEMLSMNSEAPDDYDSTDVTEYLDISSADALDLMSPSEIESIVYDQINNLTEEEFQNYIMEMENVPLEIQ
ncbi:MAG: hypothetical protein ACM3U1_12030 [Chloroflexota bacterium]